MIAVFKLVYWTVAIIDFVVCVASIVVLGLSRSAVIEACSRLYVDETTDTCSAGYRNFMIIYSVIVMIVCFIQVKPNEPRLEINHPDLFFLVLFCFSH